MALDRTKSFSHLEKQYHYNDANECEVQSFVLVWSDGTRSSVNDYTAIGMRKFAGVECREQWNNLPFNSPRICTPEQIDLIVDYVNQRKDKETFSAEDLVQYVWH
jgi:hypothetical protein